MIPPKRSHVLSEYEIARAGSRKIFTNDPCEHNTTEERYLWPMIKQAFCWQTWLVPLCENCEAFSILHHSTMVPRLIIPQWSHKVWQLNLPNSRKWDVRFEAAWMFLVFVILETPSETFFQGGISTLFWYLPLPEFFWRSKGTNSHDRRPSARRDTPPVNRRSERPESNLRGDREIAALEGLSPLHDVWQPKKKQLFGFRPHFYGNNETKTKETPTPGMFKKKKTEKTIEAIHSQRWSW